MNRSILVCLALASVAAPSAGCADRPPPVAATVPPPAPVAATPPAPAATAPATVVLSDDIRSRCAIPDADAYFGFDSARVGTTDSSPLDRVARCFATGPLAGHTVKLVGRADPRGASEYNLTLGQSRADAVGVYLSLHGVATSHESSTSRGALDASGTDASGWARDRRVDVLLGD